MLIGRLPSERLPSFDDKSTVRIEQEAAALASK
jgi:hypothetical protein